MFVAGLEVRLTSVRRLSGAILSSAVLGFLIPFALGAGLVFLVPGLISHLSTPHVVSALFLGTAMAVSALPVIARILVDLDLMHDDVGVIIMAAATLDDLVAWSLFTWLLWQNGHGSARPAPQLLLLGIVALCLVLWCLAWWGTRLARSPEPKDGEPVLSTGWILLFVLVAAAFTEWVGVHGFFGAFLVGVAFSCFGTEQTRLIRRRLDPLVFGFFAPIYFASVGLKADFVHHFDPVLALIIFGIASVGKIGGAGLGAWCGKIAPRNAVAVGVGLNARGAVELLLASLALDAHIIDERVFVALVTLAVVTSLSSSVVLRQMLRRRAATPKDLPVGLPGSATKANHDKTPTNME